MIKDFYSVQEFSKLTGVETSTLRYWDDMGVFSPTRRNPENNYRVYSADQLTAINFVSCLSDLNVPLKTIAELREERNPENFLKLLEKKEKELDMELMEIRQRSSVIHARRELINYGLRVDETQISILHRDEKAMILWPRNEYQDGDTFVAPLASFVNRTKELRINLDFPVGGYWDDLQSFQNAPSHPDCFFSIDPTGTHIRKDGEYLIGFARGFYGEMGDLPERMADYQKENSLTLSGPIYVMYLHDEICTKDPSQYLAQACVEVTKRKQAGWS
jgi:DNA-binding transcriptional MerR regulator